MLQVPVLDIILVVMISYIKSLSRVHQDYNLV